MIWRSGLLSRPGLVAQRCPQVHLHLTKVLHLIQESSAPETSLDQSGPVWTSQGARTRVKTAAVVFLYSESASVLLLSSGPPGQCSGRGLHHRPRARTQPGHETRHGRAQLLLPERAAPGRMHHGAVHRVSSAAVTRWSETRALGASSLVGVLEQRWVQRSGLMTHLDGLAVCSEAQWSR